MKGGTDMITTVIIVLTIVIVAGVFILDHFAIQREKEEQEAARKAREERRAAKEREKELVTVKATAQSGSADSLSNAKKETAEGRSVDLRTLGHITFACDAGMGSSAMGAVVLQRKLEAAGLGNVVVQHCAINKISENARYIVCPKEFAIQVADAHRRARIIPIDEFMDAPEYDKIVAEFVAARTNTNAASDQEDYHGGVLLKKNIRMNLPSKDKESVIRDIGGALVECGYVTPKYVDGMVAKEDTFNTCIGNYLAIPHGIESVIGEIKNAGLAIFGYPDGVDWGDGETAKLVIAVASAGDDHVETLGKIAGNCETEEEVEKILKMSVDEIYELFA